AAVLLEVPLIASCGDALRDLGASRALELFELLGQAVVRVLGEPGAIRLAAHGFTPVVLGSAHRSERPPIRESRGTCPHAPRVRVMMNRRDAGSGALYTAHNAFPGISDLVSRSEKSLRTDRGGARRLVRRAPEPRSGVEEGPRGRGGAGQRGEQSMISAETASPCVEISTWCALRRDSCAGMSTSTKPTCARPEFIAWIWQLASVPGSMVTWKSTATTFSAMWS